MIRAITTIFKRHALVLMVCTCAAATAFAQSNTFPSSGFVGIGTTSPNQTLHVWVNTNVWTPEVVENVNPSGGGGIQFRNDGTGISYQGGYLMMGGTGLGFTNYKKRVALISYANGSTGTGSAGITLSMEGVSEGNQDFRVVGGANSAPVFLVQQFGNVGINTSAPVYPLDVQAPTGINVALRLTGGSAGTDNTQLRFAGSKDGELWAIGPDIAQGGSTEDFEIVDVRTDTPRFMISTGGNVGIGTLSPSYPLSVNGTIEAKEVIVQTGWSDYVFDKHYRLPSLREVEQEVDRTKHLPGIPSAADVASHGVDVGAVESKLLAKVEELTLYAIQQEKRLDKQSAAIGQQAKEIDALRRENAALRTVLTGGAEAEKNEQPTPTTPAHL